MVVVVAFDEDAVRLDQYSRVASTHTDVSENDVVVVGPPQVDDTQANSDPSFRMARATDDDDNFLDVQAAPKTQTAAAISKTTTSAPTVNSVLSIGAFTAGMLPVSEGSASGSSSSSVKMCSPITSSQRRRDDNVR